MIPAPVSLHSKMGSLVSTNFFPLFQTDYQKQLQRPVQTKRATAC